MFRKETITTIKKCSFFQQGNPKCVALESHIHACALWHTCGLNKLSVRAGMGDTLKSCFDFEPDGGSIAYATADGLLRIWESSTSKLKHEFLPSAHLSSSCTCLKWRSQKSGATSKKVSWK